MNQLELRRVSSNLANALGKIEIMAGLVPICAYCKNVRNDRGFWSTVELFIQQHAPADFTHGICPGCQEAHFGYLDEPGEQTASNREPTQIHQFGDLCKALKV